MQAEIVNRSPCVVAYVRHVGPYDTCGEAWEQLTGWLATEGYFGASSEMLGLCHDDPDITDDGKIRYDACAVLGVDFEPDGSIGKKRIRGGDYVRVRHTGPYSQLGEVYGWLFGSWLPSSGREVANAPCLEIYWNDPDSTEPEELETDILLPLGSSAG